MRAKADIGRNVIATLAVLSLILFPVRSWAHPMGNFSINHYARIRLADGFVEIHYFLDLAEIPTFQELQQASIVANPGDPRVVVYLQSRAQAFKDGLLVTVNREHVALQVLAQDILFPMGAGNLPTTKFGVVYRGSIAGQCSASNCELSYRDTNFSDRAGWKEIVVMPGQGIAIKSSTASARDRSGQLSNYPTDLISSPPQDLQATILFSIEKGLSTAPSFAPVWKHTQRAGTLGMARVSRVIAAGKDTPGGSTTSPNSPSAEQHLELKANRQGTPRNRFTELIATRQIGFGIALLAAAIAAGLGALHALEPGHGKTIVAAYLVGSRGTARHALLLGTIVTISHTAGVYLLGGITLYAQRYILPDRVYPFLGVLSGILIAGMGLYLFLQHFVGAEFAHSHKHEFSRSAEPPAETNLKDGKKASPRQLLVLGVTGGIVPCPAALVVLLSAMALHRTAFGLYLIVAFSIGLAAVLVVMGLVTVYAGRFMSRLPFEAPLVQRWLPMVSSVMIALLGCGIAVQGLKAAGILQIRI